MRPPLLILLGLVMTTACGTTVNPHAALPVGTGQDEGLSVPLQPESATSGASIPALGRDDPRGSAPASHGNGPAPAPPKTQPQALTPNASLGPQTAKTGPLKIGIQTLKGGDAFAGGLGVGASFGDTQAQAQAVVDEVNRTGGIAGRRVTPAYSAYDATSTQTTAAQEQGTCADWTQDANVETAIALFATTETLHGCMHRAGVSLLAPTPRDSSYTAQFSPSLRNPVDPLLDRWAPAHVDRLAANGYFGSRPVIGLIRYDRPDVTRAVDRSLKPALQRHGLKVASEVEIQTPQGAGDVGPTVSQVSSAVLTFQSAGVTHVLDVLDGGGTILFFMQTAEQQHYRPRYGLTSFDAPAAALQATAPAAQLRNAVGAGWIPSWDVDAQHDPGLSPNGQRCMYIMKRAGQDMTSRVARQVALRICDNLFLLQKALLKGAAVTSSSVAQAFSRASYAPGVTFQTSFPGARPDGAAYLRDFRYDSTCSCFAYLSSGTTI